MDAKGNFLSLCLMDALEDEDEPTSINILTKYGANPNVVVQDRGIAPIHYACGMENVQVAERMMKLFMYDYKGDPNVLSDEKITPMHIAAMYGRTIIVKMLLEHGGDINAMDNDRKTPILYAVYGEHIDVVKAIQNFIFESKFNKTKEKIIINADAMSSPTRNENTIIDIAKQQPINHNLLSVKNLEEKKFTPNRINYNFDVTSPYYINITHRRGNSTIKTKEHDIATSTPLEEFAARRENLFKLTEDNIFELSKNMSPERSRVSIIQSWREKVQRSKSRRSILQKFNDIDSLLSGIMTNDNLDFTNTLLTLDEDEHANNTTSPPKSLLRTSFGKMLENLESAESFITAPNDESESPQNNDSNFIRSPRNNQYIVQVSEGYVHTDNENGLVLYEKKFYTNQHKAENNNVVEDNQLNKSHSTISTNLTLPLDYETEALRAELTQFGDPPGPITMSTKKLYIKKLIKYKRNTEQMMLYRNSKNGNKIESTFSVELEKTIKSAEWFSRIPDNLEYEKQMCNYFKNNPRELNRKLREGHLKQSFIYLLIDPRVSCNLPTESVFMEKHDIWKIFVSSIFYVGKGKSVRPYSHLYDALKMYSKSVGRMEDTNKVQNNKETGMQLFKSPRKQIPPSKKLDRILDIWSVGKGVVCLHVFHNIIPAEAYTREAAIIEALSLQHLTNLKRGDYYGPAQTWTMRCKKNVGIILLFKALQIYLAEGESQLSPCDLI